MRRSALFYLFLFVSTIDAASDSSNNGTILGYTPSNVLTSIALGKAFYESCPRLVLMFIVTALILLVALLQIWLMIRWGGKFMLILVIGELC
jgi:hypothetical protein